MLRCAPSLVATHLVLVRLINARRNDQMSEVGLTTRDVLACDLLLVLAGDSHLRHARRGHTAFRLVGFSRVLLFTWCRSVFLRGIPFSLSLMSAFRSRADLSPSSSSSTTDQRLSGLVYDCAGHSAPGPVYLHALRNSLRGHTARLTKRWSRPRAVVISCSS